MPNINVNLAATTGKVLSPYLWGFSLGGTAYGAEPVPFGQNNFSTVFNAAFQASAAKIKPTLCRFNTQQMLYMCQHIFANGVNNPDWTYLDNWCNNHSGFFNDATGRLVFGVGPFGTDTSTPAATWGQWVVAIANHLRAKGQECFWWEVGNESDDLAGAVYNSYYRAIVDGLLSVNPNYKVGGPTVTWWDHNNNGALLLADPYLAARVSFINYHTYGGLAESDFPDHNSIYSRCLSGEPISDVQLVRAKLRSVGLPDSIPIGLLEYNLIGDPGGSASNSNSNYMAAMFSCLYLTTSWLNDPTFQMAAVWDFGGTPASGDYGVIGNNAFGNNNNIITPQGYFLGYAGQNMHGNEVSVTGVTGNLRVIAVTRGTTFAIMFVNFDQGASSPVNLSFSNGTPQGAISRWELGKSNPSTPALTTQASLTNINIQSEQIVILTGSTAAVTPPKTLTVNSVTGAQVGQSFTVNGTLTNYGTAPSLLYSDDGGGSQPLPAGSTVSTANFSFTHPAFATSGNHTIVVSDGTVSGSVTLAVQAAGWTVLPATSLLTSTITGLSPSTKYDFQVSAKNSVGTGPLSAILQVTTIAASGVPDAPIEIRSNSVSSSAINVGWTAPPSGPAVTSYRLQSSPAGAGTWTDRATGVTITNADATGLSASTSYDFRVFAHNTAGDSVASATLTISTVAGGATVTWDTAAGAAGPSPTLAFSNGNLTLTAGGSTTAYSTEQACRSSTSKGSGKAAFEITFSAITQNSEIGLINASWFTPQDMGGTVNGIGYYPSTGVGSQAPQTIYYNGTEVLTPSGTPQADTAGAVITFCVDVTAGLFWVTSPAMRTVYGANAWNDSASANPATGVGGQAIQVSGALYIAFYAAEGGAVATLNAGSSPLSSRVPSSFPAWGGGGTIFAPGRPLGLATGNATASTMELFWNAPSVGTQPFNYQVQYAIAGSGNWVNGNLTTFPNNLVTGLAANTNYDFRVIASNAGGTSLPSGVVTKATTGTAVGESADGTLIRATDSPIGTIYDAALTPWSINAATAKMTKNGADDTNTTSVIAAYYHTHQVYHENSILNWFVLSGTTWVATADPRPAAGTTFAEEFTSLSYYNVHNSAAGGIWQPAYWYDDGVVSPDGGLVADGWIFSPFNPNTTGITQEYVINGSILQMAIQARPAGVAAGLVGGANYISGQLTTAQSFSQRGGYFEARVAVDKLDGTLFAWWLTQVGAGPWVKVPEIDICEIVTVQGNFQFAKFSLWDPYANAIVAEHYSYNMPQPIDCTQYHTYGLDWNVGAGTMTYYIDRVAQLQAPIPAGYDNALILLLSNYTGGDWVGSINNPGGLPIHANIDYVRVYASRPF